MKTCSVADCHTPAKARGFCKKHYERWARHGDPSISLKLMSPRGLPMQWLRDHSSFKGDECLIWPFARFPDGRAHMRSGKPSRVMCELVNGPPPTSRHEAAHSCGRGNDACVNPRHLRWATPAENTADKIIHGTVAVGSMLPQSKLKEEDIPTIRRLAIDTPVKEIALRYGVGPITIYKILWGQRWRHVA